MKALFNLFVLFLIISGDQCQGNLHLVGRLQGEWRCMDDMDCPDFIFFHKSGRYIIFNDCGSEHPWIPIVERGNWEIKNKNIVLKNREFVSKFSDFRNYHGTDPILLFAINRSSDKELMLTFKIGEKSYTEYYKKVNRFAELMEVYSGYGSKVKRLVLPSSGARTLLKLSYKAKFPALVDNVVAGKEEPIELIVEDQNSHVLWRKTVVFTEDVQKEEILLADKPEIINLTELVFKINTGELSPSWEFQVKIY